MRRSRTLIYAIPVIVLLIFILIYQYGYLKVRLDIATLREEEAIRVEKLKRYNLLISEGPALEKRLALLKKQRKADNAKLIKAQTASLAAATLQNTIKEMFTASGGTISSERVEKTEERGEFRIVSATINGLLPDTNALKEILYSIETNTPYLIVKSLNVRVKNYRRPTGELTVNLTVSALTNAK